MHNASTARVWAYVTAHPQASVREIGEALTLGVTTTQYHLSKLLGAGYIEIARDGARGHRTLGDWEQCLQI